MEDLKMKCNHNQELPENFLEVLPKENGIPCASCAFSLGIEAGMLKAARKILANTNQSIVENLAEVPTNPELFNKMQLEKHLDELIIRAKHGDHNSAVVMAFLLGREYVGEK